MRVAREELYEQVWAEPMVKVAERYKVSSNYLAQICARLNVPRPSRGYWQQVEVGTGGPKPPLPAVSPGDDLEWSREGPAQRAPFPPPKAPTGKMRSLYADRGRPERHELIVGARKQFAEGTVVDPGYLSPTLRRLPDVLVTKETLRRALDVANKLFIALEDRGHRVAFPPARQPLHRLEVDICSDRRGGIETHRLWRPDRATIVFVGTVAIGLTVFELSESVLVRYVNGAYERVSERASRRQDTGYTWTTNRPMPSGKLCLRASSPYHGTTWVRQWTEADGSGLTSKVEEIAAEIEEAAPVIASLVEAAERQAEIDRIEREAQFERWKREEAERRTQKNIDESRKELLAAIDAWGAVRRIEAFFEDVERRLAALPVGEADEVRDRVRHARALIGEADALEELRCWQTPEERWRANDRHWMFDP